MIEKLSKEEMNFLFDFFDSRALAECLFSDFDNLTQMDEEKLAHIRLAQIPLLSHEYILADNPKLSKKQNHHLRKGSGDVYALGGRNFGKTLIAQKIDLCLRLVTCSSQKIGYSSYDAIHIRGVLEEITPALDHHPFLRLFDAQINKSPNYRISTRNGNVVEGINMNITGKEPGKQFFQKHLHALYIDECCVDGHTKVRFLDEDGKIKTKNISYLVNSEYYKKIKVLSYNFDKKEVTFNKVTKIFKKQVKNFDTYKLILDDSISSNKRTLIVSPKQKIWTDKGYITPDKITKNNELYILDHCNLNDIQKQVLIGTLLGDGSLSFKCKNGNPVLGFSHGVKQLNYLEYKKSILKSLFKSFRNGGCEFNTYPHNNPKAFGEVYGLHSKESKCLKEFSKFKHEKVKNSYTKIDKSLLDKYLTTVSLAFWYMDDGSYGKYELKNQGKINEYVVLHTSSYDLETQNILKKVLKKKFDLDCIICFTKERYYYLQFDKDNSKKFLDLVKDYIFPELLYKLGNIKNNFIDLSCDKYALFPVKVLDILKTNKSSWTMYDFEVENDHNFFGNGLLISNSMETEQVYKLRRDSVSEIGCVFRLSGMTDFTRYTPCGQVFYDPALRGQVVNLPQYCNPNWDEKAKEKAIKDFSGENSIGYRVFIKGEIVEDGVSVFDMDRVKRCYDYNKTIKVFEINKVSFNDFENLIYIEKPKNATDVYICADVGESAPTEIVVAFKIGEKYRYEYNITLYNLTDKEQFKIFKWLAETLSATSIGIDVTDGLGRAIYRSLEEVFPKDNLVWCGFNEKIAIDFDRNDKGDIIMKDGKPTYKEEYVSEWSVKHLKDLLYNEKMILPVDYKLDKQINSVIAQKSTTARTVYSLVCQDDHLFQAMQVFSIAEWINAFRSLKPITRKPFCKSGV